MMLNEWINYKSARVMLGTYQDYLDLLQDFCQNYYFNLINSN